MKHFITIGFFSLFSFLLIIGMPLPSQAEESSSLEHYVDIRLVPEKNTIKAGETIYIGIEQNIAPHWHTYWLNPGDSGAAPFVEWTLPDQFETGELLYPIPSRIPFGPMTNYGYEGTITKLQTLTAPASLPEGPLTFKADIEVLVCKDICIPEFGTFEFTLNNPAEPPQDNSAYVTEAMQAIPVPLDWDAFYAESDGKFLLDITVDNQGFLVNRGEPMKLGFFPLDWGIVTSDDNIQGSVSTKEGQKEPVLTITKDRSPDRDLRDLGTLSFLIVLENKTSQGKDAFIISAEPHADWLAQSTETETIIQEGAEEIPASQQSSTLTLWQALAFALFGGVILNLMPCVFPVLSMKTLKLCEISDKSETEAKFHGLSYSFGVILSFVGIAALLIILKYTGAQIGWGFQLQNPAMISGLGILFFLLGLNLSGVFEFGNAFGQTGSNLAAKEGYTGSFFTGILATLVATPCTAPFMGAAIGFTLTQPAAISLLVFATLGLGLALPYLLISFVPALRSILPKPGTWMVTFKEFLAFPMYGAAVWLIWVLSQQAGSFGVLVVLTSIVIIAFSIWLGKHGGKSLVIRVLTILLFILALFAALGLPQTTVQTKTVTHGEASFTQYAFTPENLDQALSTDQPVFVNMTAAWCITCKVNERVALNIPATKTLFTNKNVIYVKGDWTNRDGNITKFLERYGRNGVPLYVFYGAGDETAGKRPEPVILPQILTPALVKDIIQK